MRLRWIQNLEGEGFTIIPFGQGFSSMSADERILSLTDGGENYSRWESSA